MNYLIGCVHKFFVSIFMIFYVKKHVEKLYMFKFFSSNAGVFNLILIFMNFFLNSFIKFLLFLILLFNSS